MRSFIAPDTPDCLISPHLSARDVALLPGLNIAAVVNFFLATVSSFSLHSKGGSAASPSQANSKKLDKPTNGAAKAKLAPHREPRAMEATVESVSC